jgi:hypothetical protein
VTERQPINTFTEAKVRREVRIAREQAYRALDINISSLIQDTPQAEAFLSWVDHQNAAASYATTLAKHENESRLGLLFNRTLRMEISEEQGKVDAARQVVDERGIAYRDPDQQNAYFGQIQRLDLLFYPLYSAVTAEMKHDSETPLTLAQMNAVVLNKIALELNERRTAFLEQDQLASEGR